MASRLTVKRQGLGEAMMNTLRYTTSYYEKVRAKRAGLRGGTLSGE